MIKISIPKIVLKMSFQICVWLVNTLQNAEGKMNKEIVFYVPVSKMFEILIKSTERR